MHVNRKFLTIGIIMIFVPFLGIPDTWKYTFIVLLGMATIFSAIQFYRPKKRNRRKTDVVKSADTFAENAYIEPPIQIKKEEPEITYPNIDIAQDEDQF